MSDLRHGLYLTTGRDAQGRLIAVCSDGTPQRGHSPVTILAVEVVQSVGDAVEWFASIKRSRPWEAARDD